MAEPNTLSAVAEFGGFRLEPARRRLVRADGQAVEITSKAFDALAYLVAHAGRPVTRSELTGALWPKTIVEDNSLSKLIVALRRALGEDEEHRYIATLPGRGYQFVAEARRVEASSAEAAAPGAVPAQAPPAAARPRARRSTVLAAAFVAAVSLAAAVFAWLRLAPASSEGASGIISPLAAPVRVSQITAYNGYELAPTLSPDGASVVFSWDGERGKRDLYMTRIGSSGKTALTRAEEPDRFPAWSPDGETIAFLRETDPDAFTLMLVPAAGGSERALRAVRFRPTAVWASPLLAWTHDSSAVIFTTGSSDSAASPHHLYKMPVGTGEPIPLTTGEGVYDTSPAVSADGRWLAFVRHDSSLVHARGTLLIQSLSAATPTPEPIVVPIPDDVGGSTPAYVIHSPSWSPDGRYLTFVVGTDLFEWELGAPAPRLIFPGTGRLGGLTLTGDLGALAMARGPGWARAVIGSVDRSSDIFALPLSPATHEALGPAAPRFVSSAGDIHPRFSPDGQRVAFISARDGSSDIWVAAADGTAQRRITDLRLPIVGFPRWSPDGRKIAFHAGDARERAVYFVDPDAGVPQRITKGCCLEWSRDGRIYVTDFVGEHMISRVRIADGQREQLFAGGFPSVTADGSTLLYGKIGERNLYARAVDGDIRNNPERVLLTDSSYPSATAAVADGFFYVRYSPASEAGQIRFYDYATRETRAVADVPAGVAELISVSPDGTELLYTAQRESGADLWLLEFEDSRAAGRQR